MTIAKPLKDRIEAHSIPEPNSGCWLWLGSVDRQGYGRMSINNAERRETGLPASQLAHRMSWLCHRGPIVPASLLVLHRCDNPACVNPDHLWLGTHIDNAHDCIAKGRDRRGTGRPIDSVGATYLPRANRWLAQISIKSRNTYIGTFKTKQEASDAYWAIRNGEAAQ